MKFDHTKDSFNEAIGISEQQQENLAERLGEITKEFAIGDLSTKSELCEKIALELSYSELLFLTTNYVTDKLSKFMSSHKEINSLLEKFIKEMENNEEK